MHEIESRTTTFLKATKEWVTLVLRYGVLALKSAGLNISVMFLELRLWYAQRQINGMLGSVENAKDRLHEACKKDAERAFETAKRDTSVGSLGLSKVIVNALENTGIHDLKRLDVIMYNLESIPGIGPSRAETIRQAFEKSLRKAAVKSGRTHLMVELTRRHVLFQSSVTSTMEQLTTKREPLRARADDYIAAIDDYCMYSDYRQESRKSQKKLWDDADAFIEELSTCRRKASDGQPPGPPSVITPETLDSLAEREWREMTFTFHIRFFSQLKVRNCSIVD